MGHKRILKGFILVFCAFACAFLFKPPRADALEAGSVFNYTGFWSIIEVDTDVFALYFDMDFTQGRFDNIVFDLPACYVCEVTVGGLDSSILIMSEGGTVWGEPLAYGLIGDYTAGTDITIDFAAGTVGNGGMYSDSEPDIQRADSVSMLILTSFTEVPPIAFGYWVASFFPVIGTSWILPLIFYDRGTVVNFAFFGEGMLGEVPSDPTPPTGYLFVGWRTKDGTLWDWNNSTIADEYLAFDETNGYHVPLYSYFRLDLTDTETTPDPDPETVPAFISGPMGMIGLDSEAGYFIIFVLGAFLLIFGILMVLKDNPSAPFIMIALFVWTVAATWMAIIPLWATAILGVFEVGFVIKAFSNGGGEAA